jgi:hypothetical protein
LIAVATVTGRLTFGCGFAIAFAVATTFSGGAAVALLPAVLL